MIDERRWMLAVERKVGLHRARKFIDFRGRQTDANKGAYYVIR